jgi:hypothetical protein
MHYQEVLQRRYGDRPILGNLSMRLKHPQLFAHQKHVAVVAVLSSLKGMRHGREWHTNGDRERAMKQRLQQPDRQQQVRSVLPTLEHHEENS